MYKIEEVMSISSLSLMITQDTVVYLIRHKSEAFEKFKGYRVETEKQLDKNIKKLRSDRGGEFLSGDFNEFLVEN